MSFSRKFLLVSLLIVILSVVFMKVEKKKNLTPPKKLPYEVVDDFITDEQMLKLRSLWIKHFPVMSAGQVDWPLTPSIGEDVDPLPNGRCPSPYLILNENLHKCIVPVRVDLAQHYSFTGGYNGWKEKFTRLLSRSLIFVHHEFFEKNPYEEFRTLYEDETSFYEVGKKVCPPTHPHILPFQVSLHLQLPGQNIPPHLDIPYYYGISRRIYPHYLLLAMDEIGLIEDYRVPIIQSMTYIHDWNPLNTTLDQHTNENDPNFKSSKTGGDIIFYVNGSSYGPVVKMTLPKRTVIIDGTRVVHTSSTFKPYLNPPKFDQNLPQKLIWNNSSQKWQLYINGTSTNQYYGWSDIRATVAWRAGCFKTEYDAHHYDSKMINSSMSLNFVLNSITSDMIKKGVITQNKLHHLPKLDLIKLILSTYIKYPKPALSNISFNYCVIFQLLPNYQWLLYFTNIICPM